MTNAPTRAGEAARTRILAAIETLCRERGRPPTYREIGSSLGMPIATLSHHVRVLRRRGTLMQGPPARSRTLARAEGDAALGTVPLRGIVAARAPFVPLSEARACPASSAALAGALGMVQVGDDGWTSMLIAQGDQIVFAPLAGPPPAGAPVVALLARPEGGEQALLGRYCAAKDGWVGIRALRGDDVLYAGPADAVRLLGIVREVRRIPPGGNAPCASSGAAL